jgi:hypothetical protein
VRVVVVEVAMHLEQGALVVEVTAALLKIMVLVVMPTQGVVVAVLVKTGAQTQLAVTAVQA